MRKLSKEQKRDIAALAAMRDEDIDFSDIPLVLDWSKAEMGKFYRPGEEASRSRTPVRAVTGIVKSMDDPKTSR